MISYADLELSLRRAGDAYAVEVQFVPAGSSAPVRLIAGDPPLVRLDEPVLQALRAAELDIRLYGERLTGILFADQRLAAAFAKAAAAAQGADAPLRLRLCLDERDPFLHNLHWEALCDPASPAQALLGTSERLRFSRFLSSDDMQPLRPRPRAALSALVVVANPAALERYSLAPIDVAGEVGRACEALGDVPTTILAHPVGERRATLNGLVDVLRAGPDILYLVCHGTLRDGEPYLWLEGDQGQIARVTGGELVEQIQNLEQRPLLVVLGSCQSAGNPLAADALAALGPRLAAAGIGAVVAMQGDVAMKAVAAFMPVFLRELRRDGQVDRAVAAARAALVAEHQWWQPVLWMRMRDGQLWADESQTIVAQPAQREPPHNLPSHPDPLIGREREVAEVCELLGRADVRLVTLLGPGGTGKTRLAIQSGWELRESLADGVFFVNLTDVREPGLVASTIAQVLGVADDGSKPLAECLKDHLRPLEILLILDNFEQVVAVAPLVAQLLAAAPRLEVLITSRVALRISGEHQYPVAPLALPDLHRLPRAADEQAAALMNVPAVALFVARAQAVKPGFTLSAANARPVAEICVQLDGLPLAIEWAAARSKLLAPQAILSRLGSRLNLLTGGGRDLPTHQQTLRSTIAWSYDLLDAGKQALFARLAVFAGGCTLEAAELVCNSSGDLPLDILDGLAALVDESLLRQTEAASGEPCFGMLATIREYALERLDQSGAATDIQQSHAAYYLALAESAAQELQGSQPESALKRLEQEHDNMRAALDWSIAQQDADTAMALGGALWRFWYNCGYLSEGRQRLEKILALGGTVQASIQANALSGAAGLAFAQCDYRRANELYEVSLALRHEIDDPQGIMRTLNNLGAVAARQGMYPRAQAYYEESLALCRELRYQPGILNLLSNLGSLAYEQGDPHQARVHYEESLALARTLRDTSKTAALLNNLGLIALNEGNHAQAWSALRESLMLRQELEDKEGIATSALNLGLVARARGDHAAAADHFTRSLLLRQELGNQAGIAECLEGLAGVAVARGADVEAARLFGAAEALREAVGAPLPPVERAAYERSVGAAQAALDAAGFVAAWAEGRALPLEQAIAEALVYGQPLVAS